MTDKRRLVHSLFLLLLPLIVAACGLSLWSALLLVLAALLWRWLIVLSGILKPEKTPGLLLETISASHFAEKARWCLDRLGVDYQERASAGVLGVLFCGRTVPRLKIRTGLVQSEIGNSPQILRFLWGNYAASHAERAAFLEPTAERLEMEKRLDRYGVDLQVWIYYHILDDRELTLKLWGADSPLVPWWQRQLLTPLYPVSRFFIRKTFRIDDAHYAKACEHVESLLGDIEQRLADGGHAIMGGEDIDFVDITFAALSGLWLQPANYGNGRADAVRVPPNRLSGAMRDDVERWSREYPRACAHVHRLYDERRQASGVSA